ncbi:MAG: hypothetical protein JW384_00832 [Nitrosomonadaceae bacterium]|nr:hypothetical protein [Nitrosomonadaceae bacterium]
MANVKRQKPFEKLHNRWSLHLFIANKLHHASSYELFCTSSSPSGRFRSDGYLSIVIRGTQKREHGMRCQLLLADIGRYIYHDILAVQRRQQILDVVVTPKRNRQHLVKAVNPLTITPANQRQGLIHQMRYIMQLLWKREPANLLAVLITCECVLMNLT